MLSKQFLIRNHLVAIREAMKNCPEILTVKVDDEIDTPIILLDTPEDVRRWADEAGVTVEDGDKWNEIHAVIDGVTVRAFGGI